MTNTAIALPQRFHLDRRADRLIEYGAAAGAPDDLLTTADLAAWLGCSTQWCEIGRHRGYSPPYLKLSGRVRYRRADVVQWLVERAHRRTSEYQPRRRTAAFNGPTARFGFRRGPKAGGGAAT